ncbi:MAG: Do family serine endopeptidase [Burkholderiaceae bacterium]|nr:Do family serine endopeptidase [Burkholderiaceae bacterium]MCD8517566.1 Do family serine endopeptidase [Burkholderiaceae bacterium]MCD8537364.1 Do family serine endopeptidase [Burkholderiaceae bacterium]MCD8564580.1 Do family serine endopeptidase [Burkholderiaceae bacterium]
MALMLWQFSAPGRANTVGLPDFTAIVEKAEPAVVNIRTTATVSTGAGPGGRDPYEMFRWFFGPDFQPPGGGGNEQAPQQRRGNPEPQERTVPRGVGSGFFISADGYILTNHHVIDEASEIFVTLTDGTEYKAKVIGSDERTDVALLKIDAENMATLPIGTAVDLKKGQWVLAIGSPFGLESTVTSGIVSAIGRETGDYLPFIQTDVAVNPGNSGGPLLDLNGEVVGINAQIVSRSGGFMGISLAIPIDEAMEVAQQLRENGKVTRGRIGVQIAEVSKDVAQASGLDSAAGAMVSRVVPDGPAEAAGVEPGDIILEFDGKKIEKWSDLPRVVGSTAPGTKSKMNVWRKGKPVTLSITVGETPSAAPVAAASQPAESKPAGETALGVTVVSLTDDEKKEFRINHGVKVTAAEGAGAAAGLTAGDVILTVDNTDVSSPKQFVELAEKAEAGKPLGMMVQRNGQAQWLLVRPAKK